MGVESKSSWRKELEACFVGAKKKVHLVGVGNPVRGDDAAGLEVAAALKILLRTSPATNLRVHGPSDSPERTLSKLAANGSKVIVVDAVEAGEEPGTIVCANLGKTKFGFFATHNVPLRLIPGVSERLDQVYLVGIQPERMEVGGCLSAPVLASIKEVATTIAELVRPRP